MVVVELNTHKRLSDFTAASIIPVETFTSPKRTLRGNFVTTLT